MNEPEFSGSAIMPYLEKEQYDLALPILKSLAQEGSAYCQCELGRLYLFGRGVPQNVWLAKKWFRRSARGHYGDARASLAGILWSEGDRKASIAIMEKASLSGYLLAQYRLGVMHELRSGPNGNLPLAVYYYRAAMQKGHVFAKRRAGILATRGLVADMSRLQGIYFVLSSWMEWLRYRIKNKYDFRIME